MALVTGGTAYQLNTGDVVYGLEYSTQVGGTSSTKFTRSNGSSTWEFTGTGLSNYDADGVPHSGTITGVKFFQSNTLVLSMTQASLSMVKLLPLLESGDTNGLAAYVYSGNDTIRGTAQGDSLAGFGGNNIVSGGDGDDVITSFNGHDQINGGRGVDQVYIDRETARGATYDFTNMHTSMGVTLADGSTIKLVEQFDLRSGNGADKLVLNGSFRGYSTFVGGGGVDQVIVNLTGSNIDFQISSDRIVTYLGNRGVFWHEVERLVVTGGAGDDKMFGLSQNDVFLGADGDDDLNGSGQLNGGNGNDVIHGGASVSKLSGGTGDDWIHSQKAGDIIHGGQGADDLLTLSRYNAKVDFAISTAAIASNAGVTLADGTVIKSIDRFAIGLGRGNDVLTIDNALTGSCNFDGNGGVDRVVADLSSLTDAVSNATNPLITSTFRLAINRVEELHLQTGSGADELYGLVGNDVLHTGAGADLLDGGRGNDILDGGADGDTLRGGEGADTLTGGLGADFFVFNLAPAAANADMITDFTVGEDIIRVRGSVFGGLGAAGTLDAARLALGPAAADSDDRLIYDGSTGRLYYDGDGNGAAAQVLVATLDPGLSLTNADFRVF